MSIFQSLSVVALRQLVSGACNAVGLRGSGDEVAYFLTARFTDHSQKLTTALQSANERAWKALEIALAGDSFWDKCKVAFTSSEDQAFRQQVRTFLDASPFVKLQTTNAKFCQQCLGELRQARKRRLLQEGQLAPTELAQRVGTFAGFSDPDALLDAEWQVIDQMAEALRRAECVNLARLLSLRPKKGMSMVAVGARYFFRREVETDPELFQGLAFAKLEAIQEGQQRGFAELTNALTQQGQRLEDLLSDVKAVVVQTHSAVLDLQGQIKGQSEQIQQISQAVTKLLEQHQFERRELRPQTACPSAATRNGGWYGNWWLSTGPCRRKNDGGCLSC